MFNGGLMNAQTNEMRFTVFLSVDLIEKQQDITT